MCVVSAVHTGYSNVIPGQQQWPLNPTAPQTLTVEEIRKVIDEYRKALAGAEEVDKITNQPDCEDPEKAKLLDRVGVIEARLDAIEARFAPLG